MKKFRIKNLTVAVDGNKDALQACGPNFSCPGGPAGSFCGITFDCNFRTLNCGHTFGCDFITNDCFFTRGCRDFTGGGCGLNFSTIAPTDVTQLVQAVDPVDRPRLIDVLKSDLNQALEQLDVAGEQAQAQASPQSLEEIDELQDNLEGALKEVKSMKKKLKKK